MTPTSERGGTARSYLFNLGIALAYAVVFVWSYFHFLNYYFWYAGFTIVPHSATVLAWSVLAAVIPVLAYRGIHGIASLVAVYMYALVYTPIVLTFAFASQRPVEQIVVVQLTFMVGMCLLFLADTLPVANPVFLRLGINAAPIVLTLTAASTLYVLYVYRGNLSFASFGSEIYEHRFENLHLGAGLLMRYLSSWLTNVFVPLCLAYGLVTRRASYLVVGIVACVVLYMAAAAKIIILFPGIYIGFYLVFRHGRIRSTFAVLVGGLGAATAVLTIAARWSTTLFLIASLLIYRTVGNSGQLTVEYDEFFATHPQTMWSHIHAIDYLTHAYPYGTDGIGQVVGQFYTGIEMNANANFWATDGVAAMGLIGVGIASVICMLVLMAMDSITREYDTLFVMLCFTPFIVKMTQTSVFSALWSGGGFFLLGFFLLNRYDARLARTPRAKVITIPAAESA